MKKTERKFTRALTIKNACDKKHDVFEMAGEWQKVLGNPETTGAWLIYGAEKNGKTWLALMLANYLSTFETLYYMSAEEGISKAIVDALHRVNIDRDNRRITLNEYEPLDELYCRLKARRAPRIIVIDNLTSYNNELKNGRLRQLLIDFPDRLFVFIAHEERKEPYTVTGKIVKKLAKIIIRVEGLACSVSGRCPGGLLIIDQQAAALYHGHDVDKTKIFLN
jgi:hypothetical protein